MRLGDLILENIEPILQQWEDFAITIKPNRDLDSVALRSHAKKMLKAVVTDLTVAQIASEQSLKRHSAAPTQHDETAIQTNAVMRLMAGFTINQMVSEYRVLRMSVLMMWMQRIKSGTDFEVEDMMHFNEAVDQALAQSIASYSGAVEETRSHFRILGHDMRTHLGAIMLSADILVQRKGIGVEATNVASRIYSSVKRADQIVGDLLKSVYERDSLHPRQACDSPVPRTI
jgi:K+-sensing histidine kinase KdpD